jgi:hypothetical protein
MSGLQIERANTRIVSIAPRFGAVWTPPARNN